MIVLPWPPKELSANARPHFMARARATKAYRTTAHWATLAAKVPPLPAEGDIPLSITFYPKSNRVDRQNLPHLVKSGIDGIADALGINDKRFLPSYGYGDPVKGGKIVVTINV